MAPSHPPPSSSLKPLETEKDVHDTTITQVGNRTSTREEQESIASIEGALSDLLCGAFLPCIPVVLVTTLLLTLIFYHRVDLDPGWQLLRSSTTGNIYDPTFLNRTLQLQSKGGDAAYYIRFNPALLAAIASWTSKILPFLTSSSMAVFAFFAGRRILEATKAHKPDQLPTPHQMSILINLLRGSGTMPLWDTVVYRWNNHERLVQPIPLAAGALSFIVIITLLIGAADTWFAAATKPLNVELLSRHLSPVNTFARDLNPSMCSGSMFEQRPCPSNPQVLCDYPCSIADWNYTSAGKTSQKEGIKGAQEAAETLLGNSYTNLIQNTSYQTNSTDYGAQQYYFLADGQIGQVVDFLANTTAVTTQCEVVTQFCQINSTGAGFSYAGYRSPSFTYSGEVGVDPIAATAPGNMSMVGIQFFKDPGLQKPIGFGSNTTELFSAQNPIHFLTWSKGFPPIDTTSQTFDEMRNGKYLQLDSTGDNVFVLNCTTTISTTIYAWVNGTILQGTGTQGFYPALAPASYGAIFTGPFAIDSALSHLALSDAAALAAYKTTPADLAAKFADAYSSAAVAMTAGIMSPGVSMLEQSRNNTELLTRVPLLPLYFLVSLKALYALAALVVAALAVCLTNPSEAQEIKARLTVDGLVVGLFEERADGGRAVEQIQELYGEHRGGRGKNEGEGGGATRVGMRQTERGGWVWVASGKGRGTGRAGSGVYGGKAAADSDGGEGGGAGGDGQVLKEIM